MILERQLLLLISLGRATRLFPFHKSRVFKTVDNLPKSGCSSKLTSRSDHVLLRETQELPLGLCGPQLACYITARLEKDCASMTFMYEVTTESLFLLKRNGSMTQVSKVASGQTSGTMSFGQRPKWRGPHTSYQAWLQRGDNGPWCLAVIELTMTSSANQSLM